MPFAFTWTNVDPADATPANLLGKDIRDLRAAIQERMDDQFCDPSAPWSASDPTHPIVVAPKILGNVVGKSLTMHHSNFHPASGSFAGLSYTDLYIQNTSNTVPGSTSIKLVGGVNLPVGVTIKNVNMMVDPRGAGSIVGTLQWIDYGALLPTIHVIAAIASGGASGISFPAQAANVPVNNGMTIMWSIILSDNFANGSRFYGIQISYDTPDCRSTM